jgi:hypothetical protein
MATNIALRTGTSRSCDRSGRSPMRARRLGRLTIAASLAQAVWATRRQWQALPPGHRDRLQALLREPPAPRRTCRTPSARNSASWSESSTSAKCSATPRRARLAEVDAGERRIPSLGGSDASSRPETQSSRNS